MTRLFNLGKSPVVLSIIVSLLVFGLYFGGVAGGPVGFADSDELLAISYHGGLVHAPGYPLATFMTHLSMNYLTFIESLALRAHILAALLQAASVSLFVLVVLEMMKSFGNKIPDRIKLITAAGSGLMLALNFLYWQYALVWEVMPLFVFLALTSLFLTLRWRESEGLIYVVLWGVILGLLISHHQLSWLLVPGLVVLFVGGINLRKLGIETNKLIKVIVGIVTALVTAIGVYSSLWILRGNNSPVSWDFEPTFSGWTDFVFRRLYSGQLASGEQQGGAYLSGFSLSENGMFLYRYVTEYLPAHMGLFGLVLVLLGLYWFYKHLERRELIGWLLLILPISLGVGAYLVVPSLTDLSHDSLLLRGMTERMYIVGYVLLSLMTPFGLISVYEFLERKGVRYASMVLLVLIGINISWLFINNGRAVALDDYRLSAELYGEILNEAGDVPIVCFSDWSCFGLMAAKYLGESELNSQIVYLPEQLKNEGQRLDLYPSNPRRLIETMIAQAYSGNETYVVELGSEFADLAGVNDGIIALSPNLYGQKAVCEPEMIDIQELEWVEMIFDELPDTRSSYKLLHRSILSSKWQNNALLAAEYWGRSDGVDWLEMAREIAPWDDGLKTTAARLASIAEDADVLDYCPNPIELATQARECLEIENMNCALRYGLWAVLADSTNTEARQLLAEIYDSADLSELAEEERRVVGD